MYHSDATVEQLYDWLTTHSYYAKLDTQTAQFISNKTCSIGIQLHILWRNPEVQWSAENMSLH